MARMSLDQIIKSRPNADREKIEQTSENDVRRHAADDGHDLIEDASGLVEDLPPALVRKRHGMTQKEFADALQIPVATLRNWEQNRVAMDPAARALMRLAVKADLKPGYSPSMDVHVRADKVLMHPVEAKYLRGKFYELRSKTGKVMIGEVFFSKGVTSPLGRLSKGGVFVAEPYPAGRSFKPATQSMTSKKGKLAPR